MASFPTANIYLYAQPTEIARNGKAIFPAAQKDDGVRDIKGFDIEPQVREILPHVRVGSEGCRLGGVPLSSCLRMYQYILPDWGTGNVCPSEAGIIDFMLVRVRDRCLRPADRFLLH